MPRATLQENIHVHTETQTFEPSNPKGSGVQYHSKLTELNSHYQTQRDSSASFRCVFMYACTLFWNHYLLCLKSHLTEDHHPPDLGAFSVGRQSLLNLFCTQNRSLSRFTRLILQLLFTKLTT